MIFFLCIKQRINPQVLIEFILLAVLIAGYLINKLYETNYFVSDTYFYLGMVLAVIIYCCILWLHRYKYINTDDERKKKNIINSIPNNSCNHIFIWISDSLDSILLDFNMILN